MLEDRRKELETIYKETLKESENTDLCDSCIKNCKGKDIDGMCDDWEIE